ncbi:acid protease [Gloeophyllum trabeum ATCC 11539]|uniref:Acid protease n=1 Tax=Gloeophyllum trabeum (strain ATCC 11539 / FP-39264 / Madison 617) TaxID=670483 RepID=S7RER9_GLOTA|nr:acid protease [Gloeophyllum trabeum ATCC 11539]EPQ52745.1 acid protease [Gloeophyllum trabeum ATCC 11539]
MQLGLSFSLLLASLLVALSSSQVDAHPVKRNAGLVTLPLKRVHQARGDVHPQMLLQQHMNRGHRRLARMTGRIAPNDTELEANLRKRMYLLPYGPGSKRPTKRYDRSGVASAKAKMVKSTAKTNSAVADSNEAFSIDDLIGLLTGNGNNAQAAGKQQAKGNAKGSNGKGKGAAAGNGNATASGSAAAASSSAGAGFSEVDLQALENGGLTAAGAPTADNSLGLDIEANDVGYIATVQMGTPPRDFKLLMDSGSADLWVGSEQCQSTAGGGCGNHTFLGSQSSSSFKDTGNPFQVTYGSGAVAGNIVTDNINVAGLALNAHTFGVATQETQDFSSDQVPFDGLMGLAQSTLSEQKTLTPVESLAKAGLINDAITSYKISRLADQKNDGEITFGGIDETKIDASTLTTFDNVNTQGFWEGAMDSITADGKDLGLTGRTAILDTGTTLIIAPPQDATAVHQAIPGAKSDGQGGFTIPCTTTTSLALSFGGTSFAIDPRDLAFQPLDPNDLTGDCVSGISSGQIGAATEWLVGDVFLKNAYFSTDVTKNQISLAKLA